MFGSGPKSIGRLLTTVKGNIVFAQRDIETAIREIQAGDYNATIRSLQAIKDNQLKEAKSAVETVERLNNQITTIIDKILK